MTVADAHNDLLVELAYRSHEPNPFARFWLDQLTAGGVKVQVCPVSARYERLPEGTLREALEQVIAFERAARENPDAVAIVRTREDLAALRGGSRIGLILSLEGAEPLGYDVDFADLFWMLGARMFSLTWNRRNPFADGVGENASGGLSALGRRLIERLCALGAMIDLSHASERSFYDVLEAAAGHPVLVSHAACRAVCDTPRNLGDDQMRALAGAGGVMGIMALPQTTDAVHPTIERVADHVEHALSVMGGDRVALGGDFFAQVARTGAVRKPPDSMRPDGMGMEVAIEGLEGPGDYPRLVSALEARGIEGPALEAILDGNLVRFLSAALPSAGGPS